MRGKLGESKREKKERFVQAVRAPPPYDKFPPDKVFPVFPRKFSSGLMAGGNSQSSKVCAPFSSKRRSFKLDACMLFMVLIFDQQEYSVQITFRQKWNDDRLSYDQRLSLGDMRCE